MTSGITDEQRCQFYKTGTASLVHNLVTATLMLDPKTLPPSMAGKYDAIWKSQRWQTIGNDVKVAFLGHLRNAEFLLTSSEKLGYDESVGRRATVTEARGLFSQLYHLLNPENDNGQRFRGAIEKTFEFFNWGGIPEAGTVYLQIAAQGVGSREK